MDKIFVGQNFSSDKIFATSEKFCHYCPTLFCPMSYMKDKPRNYGLLFRVLVDTQNRYASRIILYATPPINNAENKGNIHELVMEISKGVLKTGRNITGERLYFVIDAMEELCQNKTTYVGTIMPKKNWSSSCFENH